MKQKKVSLFLFKAEEEYVMNFLTKYKFEEFILPASQKNLSISWTRKNSILFL